MRADGYRWWIERFRRTFELVDLTRVDHFRGFVSYWAVPERHKTARYGVWRRGPGAAVFRAVEAALGPLPVVAEDLGVITEPVVRLRHELGFPGMRVLQFGLGGDPSNPHLPRTTSSSRSSTPARTTTTRPSAGGSRSRLTERAWTELDPADPAWSLIAAAWASRAALAIAPLQDVLRLGNEARMNLPGTETGNWSWRFKRRALTAELAGELRDVTARSGRCA